MALADPCKEHAASDSTGARVVTLAPAPPGWEVEIEGDRLPVAAWAHVRVERPCGCVVDHMLAAVPAVGGGLRVVDTSEPHAIVPAGVEVDDGGALAS
jgi:hypothetical protein